MEKLAIKRLIRTLEIAQQTKEWAFVKEAKASLECMLDKEKLEPLPYIGAISHPHKHFTLKEASEMPCSD